MREQPKHEVRPRPRRGRAPLAACALTRVTLALAGPYIPQHDSQVLAVLPAGATHASAPVRAEVAARLDVALPLAQFYISQARASGDLRFLGYAEAVLEPWRARTAPHAAVLVLEATILQSRHDFSAALVQLDRALASEPGDAQAWLTRATVLRVLGRYGEAADSCAHVAGGAADVASLCTQSLRSLDGALRPAYEAISQLPAESLSNEARAWRCSELGEMAVRLGEGAAAARWFAQGLRLAPGDAYARAAYADLLLSQGRPAAALALLQGWESQEPLLLRIAIAQRQLHDPQLARTRALLAEAFAVEERRGEAVHRREQARFLLDVTDEPAAALAAAEANWRVQREPADLLILLRAAQAAQRPQAAAPAVQFVREHRLEDVRLQPLLGSAA